MTGNLNRISQILDQLGEAYQNERSARNSIQKAIEMQAVYKQELVRHLGEEITSQILKAAGFIDV